MLSNLRLSLRRTSGRASERASVGILLSLAFISRWLLSGRNSYWLDELKSVATYGVWQKSGSEVVESLANSSIHPPLYQLILYYWMRAFGDGEIATRFLSNLYVAGAGLCLYLTAREAMGRRRASMATLFFSLMYCPFYYAMETRSYAQTLLLSSLSSLAFFRFMRVLASSSRPKEQLLSRAAVLLVIANSGMLLTHYFNVLFLTSQGLFLLGWVAWRAHVAGGLKPSQLAAKLLLAATPLVAPLVVLLVLWGPVMVRSYRSRGDQYTVGKSVTDPFTAFVQWAVSPNFLASEQLRVLGAALLVACGALLVLFYREQARAAYRVRGSQRVGKRTLGFYALVVAFVPFALASALFALSGHQRYSDRYFIFSSPALAIMLVLAVEQAVLLLDRLMRRRRMARGYLAHWALCALVVAVPLVLPGTYVAATYDKVDWRGVAKMVADITSQDPKHSYLLYSAGRGRDRFNYYLGRVGSKVRTRARVTLLEQHHLKRATIFRDKKEIARHDFLIVAFLQTPATSFSKVIAKLDKAYEEHFRLLDDGHGIIIYRVAKPGS